MGILIVLLYQYLVAWMCDLSVMKTLDFAKFLMDTDFNHNHQVSVQVLEKEAIEEMILNSFRRKLNLFSKLHSRIVEVMGDMYCQDMIFQGHHLSELSKQRAYTEIL